MVFCVAYKVHDGESLNNIDLFLFYFFSVFPSSVGIASITFNVTCG